MNDPAKRKWQERALETQSIHKKCIRTDNKHNITNTADLLHRSLGSICEDLMLAEWLQIYPRVEEFNTMAEALSFIRKKKKEMKLR